MGPAISDILPYALVVALSPIPIIAVILMLFSARARANGPAFLLGWAVGLSTVCLVVAVLAGAFGVGTDADATDGASTLKVVLGIVLVLAAIRRWRARPAPGVEPELPAWMATVDSFTPLKAAGLGVLLSAVNPKNLLLTVAATSTVAQLNLSDGDEAVTLAIFVVLGSSSVLAAVLFRLVGGDRAHATLEGWKVRLQHDNEVVMAVLFLVFGVVILAQGLGLLTA